jgi:hypothetical protein
LIGFRGSRSEAEQSNVFKKAKKAKKATFFGIPPGRLLNSCTHRTGLARLAVRNFLSPLSGRRTVKLTPYYF